MSQREKTAWACLLSTVLVYVPYFAYVFWLARSGDHTVELALSAFIGAVVVQVVIQIVAGIAIAVTSKPQQQPKDERDRAIDDRAVRIAYFVLVSACFVAIPHFYGFVLVTNPQAAIPNASSPAVLCQLFLFGFVLAEVTRFAVQAISYRRGA